MCFLCKVFAWPFCAFLLEHSLISRMTFSRFRSSFLSDLFCSHSEVKLVANTKSVVAYESKGQIAQSEVQKVIKREVNGWNRGGVKCFSTGLSFESYSSDVVGLCFIFMLRTIQFCGSYNRQHKKIRQLKESASRKRFVGHLRGRLYQKWYFFSKV